MLTSDRRQAVIGRNPRRDAVREPRRNPQGSWSRPTARTPIRATMMARQVDRSKSCRRTAADRGLRRGGRTFCTPYRAAPHDGSAADVVRQRSMRAAKESTGREVAVTLPPKVGACRHFRRHMATSRPASRGEAAGMGGRARRSKGCLDVDCRKETPTRRRSCFGGR